MSKEIIIDLVWLMKDTAQEKLGKINWYKIAEVVYHTYLENKKEDDNEA